MEKLKIQKLFKQLRKGGKRNVTVSRNAPINDHEEHEFVLWVYNLLGHICVCNKLFVRGKLVVEIDYWITARVIH